MTVIVLGYCDAPGSQGMTLHARGNDCVNWSPQHITQVDDHVQDMTLKEYWTKGPGSTPLSLNHRTKEKNVELHRNVEIEFTDGEKRVIPKATFAYVENGVLHVENVQRDNGIVFAEVKDLGRFPIVHIKSYRWME